MEFVGEGWWKGSKKETRGQKGDVRKIKKRQKKGGKTNKGKNRKGKGKK